MIQDRFRSSLSGSSNKFSHLSFALKSNTAPILEWKLSYHKHQIKNINTTYQDCCATWSLPLGQNTPTSSPGALGNRDSSPCALSHRPGTPQAPTLTQCYPRAALQPGWHLQEALPPSCQGHTATGSCYTGLAWLQGLGYRPVPLQMPPWQLREYYITFNSPNSWKLGLPICILQLQFDLLKLPEGCVCSSR